MYEHALAANVWKLQVIRIIRWFVLILPVIVPFYQENGLSMTRILVLQSVFSLAAAFGAGGLFFAVLGACSLIGLVRSWAQEKIRYRKEAGIPEPAAAG
jgi:predicted PurR-regulated permease PerM